MIKAQYDLDLTPAERLRAAGIRKAVRIGLSRAAKPVKASVVSHALAVKRFGFLAKSIRIKTIVYPADKYVVVIGPSTTFTRSLGKFKRGKRKGQKKVAIPAKYAHLVEEGTSRSRAKPWLKPAYEETAGPFLARVREEIGREVALELDRETARGGGRGPRHSRPLDSGPGGSDPRRGR